MEVIINADDFGLSSTVNKAIIQAFRENLISCTTIMVNMAGFEEACELAFSENLLGRIGIHLNLTEGKPLTEEMALNTTFCTYRGVFKSLRQNRFYLRKSDRVILRKEFQAQIDKLKKRGINPTHIDSHHHYHTEWAVGSEIIRVARQNMIRKIRISRNCGTGLTFASRIYKIFYNNRLRFSLGPQVDYFGSVNDILTLPSRARCGRAVRVEVMVHPGFNRNEELVDLSNGELLWRSIDRVKDKCAVNKLSHY